MSGARPDTWMPLYWGDYLRDTMHLSAVEHGAYLLLIGQYWVTGKALPDNDGVLSRVTRLSLREWTAIKDSLSAFFRVVDGTWVHGRVEDELAKARERYERRAKAGAKGGASKAPPEKEAMLKQCLSNAQAGLKQSPPQPQPHSLTGGSEPSGSDGVAVVVPPDLRKSIFDDGLPWLAEHSNKPAQALRPLVARWCRDYSDEHVLTAIRACMRSPPVDPVSWIERNLRGNPNGNRNHKVSDLEIIADVARQLEAANPH